MLSRARRLGAGDVLVCFAPTSDLAAPGVVTAALDWLAAPERGRYQRFQRSEDRQMFLLGRVMARALVGAALDLPPAAWPWREGPRGRPEIALAGTALHFNLAHSAGLVVCGLAAGREIGIDVEDLHRRRVEPAVVRRYCAPEEIADIEAQGDGWHDRFLHYWTLKEAYLKARGLGISVRLEEVGFRLHGPSVEIAFGGALAGSDRRWTFELARPTVRHLVAVAVSTADGARPRLEVGRLAGYLPGPPVGTAPLARSNDAGERD